jgi:hypothetical protein
MVGSLAFGSLALAQRSESPRAAAPIDLTGTWVSIVNEDWRWRMVTPPHGDYASVPLNDAGRAEADRWDQSLDGSCRAYGAAGLLRLPLRLQIDWDGSDTLVIETDAGRQTRFLRFGAAAADGAGSLQGQSVAQWQLPQLRTTTARGQPESPADGTVGTLKVETTNLAPGWLRRNGVPYSDETRLTEYFSRFASPDGAEWFVVTTIVDDPVYLRTPFVTSSHFRRERNNAGWRPRDCRGEP